LVVTSEYRNVIFLLKTYVKSFPIRKAHRAC